MTESTSTSQPRNGQPHTPGTFSAGEALFASRTSWLLACVSGFLVLLAVVMALYGQKRYDTSATPKHSYSNHVLGHKALTSFLRQFNINVVRMHSPRRLVHAKAPLFLIEPIGRLTFDNKTISLSHVVKQRLDAGLSTVLVMNKWNRTRGPGKGDTYRRVSSVSIEFALNQMLPKTLSQQMSVFQERIERKSDGKKLEWTSLKEVWNPTGELASRKDQAQLSLSVAGPQFFSVLTPENWEVLLGQRNRALLLRYRNAQGGSLLLLSDPDLIHNFNLQRGENSVALLGMVRDVLKADTILVDEVFHNQVKQFSLARELGRFPRSLLVIHGLLLWLLFVWAGSRRFGKPVQLEQARQHGPKEVIEITSWVLVCGQKPSRLASLYVRRVLEDLAERLGLGHMGTPRQLEQIDTLAERWGTPPEAADLYNKAVALNQRQRASWSEVMRLVRRAWSFREKLLHHRSNQ
ncbi:MAG: hypothetical protein EP343_14460 [Deltaproteobacteria bacterium]|nr:MAG: hypothetical protein EP343_14460 [Deltaproteobacteria bacterium]